MAVDDHTLERVADYVLSPMYPLPGMYMTEDEADDEASRELRNATDAIDVYLAAHGDVSGGKIGGWRNGRRIIRVRMVGDLEGHRAALAWLADRVVVESAVHTEAELDALAKRVFRDRSELESLGIELDSGGSRPDRECVELDIAANDAVWAQRELTRRYGPLVRVASCLPAFLEQARAFGSWSASGRAVEVYYAVDRNGEQPGRCEVVEHTDAIAVSVFVEHPTTGMELYGGYRPMTASVMLRDPLGSRHVIDGSTGQPRPSVAALRRESSGSA